LWSATGWGSGDHSCKGILVAWGQGIRPGRLEAAALVDVAPTVLYLFGHPIPSTCDGQVLLSALDPGLAASCPVLREEQVAVAEHSEPAGPAMTAEEEAEVQVHLRGLGYL